MDGEGRGGVCQVALPPSHVYGVPRSTKPAQSDHVGSSKTGVRVFHALRTGEERESGGQYIRLSFGSGMSAVSPSCVRPASSKSVSAVRAVTG